MQVRRRDCLDDRGRRQRKQGPDGAEEGGAHEDRHERDRRVDVHRGRLQPRGDQVVLQLLVGGEEHKDPQRLRRLVRQRDDGTGVLIVSEDLDELLSLADRILVMTGGRIVGTFDARTATRTEVGEAMMGATTGTAS